MWTKQESKIMVEEFLKRTEHQTKIEMAKRVNRRFKEETDNGGKSLNSILGKWSYQPENPDFKNKSEDVKGLNPKYPVPNKDKFDKLVKELHSTSWDPASVTDYRKYKYIVGLIKNYWTKKQQPNNTFINPIRWHYDVIRQGS